MNINHLLLMQDRSEETNYEQYQPDENQRQQMTLSQIAERLRLISDQMKNKRPLKTMQDIPLVPQKIEEGIKDYLNDIARAVLAEYNARRNSHNELLAQLGRIEHFLVAMQKDKSEDILSDRQALMKDTAEELGGRLRQELAAQTKEFVAENQKTNQEISRQLREAVATSHFSVQLASLQKQITNIQAKLDTYNNVGKGASLENKAGVIKPRAFSPQAPVPATTLTENQANTNEPAFEKSVIRKLAAGKIDAPAGKFQSTNQEHLPKAFKRPNDEKTNAVNLASQAAAQNMVGVHTAKQMVQSAKTGRLSFQFGFRKIFTRIAAIF